jgi:hypothetical protein
MNTDKCTMAPKAQNKKARGYPVFALSASDRRRAIDEAIGILNMYENR